jgi:tetratricopeptide (TPR) repeat protein
MNRFFSNSLVLALFCAGFYLLTAGINWLSSDESGQRTPELSFDRRMADEFWRKRQWSKAAGHFANLTVQDPYNGSAWSLLGDCYGNMRFEYIRMIYQELEKKSVPDMAKVADCKQSAETLGNKAIPAYEHALDFPRFRNQARFNLARIYAFKGDHERALQYLSEAIEDDFVCEGRNGLDGIYELSSMKELEQFQELVIKSKENAAALKKGSLGTRR